MTAPELGYRWWRRPREERQALVASLSNISILRTARDLVAAGFCQESYARSKHGTPLTGSGWTHPWAGSWCVSSGIAAGMRVQEWEMPANHQVYGLLVRAAWDVFGERRMAIVYDDSVWLEPVTRYPVPRINDAVCLNQADAVRWLDRTIEMAGLPTTVRRRQLRRAA